MLPAGPSQPGPAPAGRGAMPTPGLHRAPAKHQPPAKTGQARALLAQKSGYKSSWQRPAFSWEKRAQTPRPEPCSPHRVEKHHPGAVSPSNYLCPQHKCGSGRGWRKDGQHLAALAGVWETVEGPTSPMLLWVKWFFLLFHPQPVLTTGKALGAASAAPPASPGWCRQRGNAEPRARSSHGAPLQSHPRQSPEHVTTRSFSNRGLEMKAIKLLCLISSPEDEEFGTKDTSAPTAASQILPTIRSARVTSLRRWLYNSNAVL